MPTATQTASPQVHGGQPSSPDHCILLPGVRWETYESLLADMQDSHAAHFAYDQGMLEIMAPSHEHESLKHVIAMLVEVLAEEMEMDIHGGGSTTFRREDLAKGFESDECFYIQHAERVRGKKQIDLAQGPISPDDQAFLLEVYASTRREELALVDWDRMIHSLRSRLERASPPSSSTAT